MADYKFDKTVFREMTFKEADATNVFDKQTPLAERLQQAYYLTLLAYGYSQFDEPKLDRTYFSSRKMNS